MSDTDVSPTVALPPRPVADDELPDDIPTPAPEPPQVGLGVWVRAVAVVLFCVVVYAPSYADHVVDAFAGSRAAYLVVLPVFLAILIATGYRTASHGVGDGESDWIVAALIGILGWQLSICWSPVCRRFRRGGVWNRCRYWCGPCAA